VQIGGAIRVQINNNNPYDGHTLNAVISGMSKTTGIEPDRIYVDKGYRGHDYPYKFKVFKSGQKRGVTAAIKKELRRRSVIEPVIGHMKN
jgi:IS5 family transposase